MSKQFADPNGHVHTPWVSSNTYSARIQEAMRHNKLYSTDYPLAITLLNAVKSGLTMEQWQEEQQRRVTTLTNQAPDATRTHADAANRYEQTISNMRDMQLWPWE